VFIKRIVAFAGSLLALGIFASAALADGDVKCTDKPASSWKHKKKDAEKAAKDAGYDVRKTLITKGGCFEVYGVDKDDQIFELFYNPAEDKLKLVATVKK